jgi:acetamidase/formamidase
MSAVGMSKQQTRDIIEVDQFTRGLVGPDVEWAGIVADGGTIRTHTPAGCWGPMITPSFKGGHEVTRPVAVEGAEVGDALAVHIESIEVTSVATSTGSMLEREGAFGDDPFVDHKCPECGTAWPDSVVEGTGEESIRCAECGTNASSFAFEYGYTVAFDDDRSVGITLDADAADELANRAAEAMALPEHSEQHPILLYKPSEMPGTLGHSARSSATSAPHRLSNSPTRTTPVTSASSSSARNTTGGCRTRRRSPVAPTVTWTSTPSGRARRSSVP